jgi:hypothetical protein
VKLDRTALCVGLALAVGSGCQRDRPAAELDRALVEVRRDELVVKTGPVVSMAFTAERVVDEGDRVASYVLVEARNRAEVDALITLGGALLDEAGGELGRLGRESLRVPAGGARLFALVDVDKVERPAATGARIEVAGAMPVDYPAAVVVTDGHVYRDGDRVDVNGTVLNNGERPAAAVVLFGLFDAAGRPVDRVATLFRLAPGGRRSGRWVGPPGSAGGSMFIGEVSYY